MGGASVRGDLRIESNLGARAAQSGARCLPRITRAAECVVSRESGREFHVRSGAGSPNDTTVRGVLRAALGGTGLAVDRGCTARNMGFGSERNILRGALHPH